MNILNLAPDLTWIRCPRHAPDSHRRNDGWITVIDWSVLSDSLIIEIIFMIQIDVLVEGVARSRSEEC